MAGIKRIKDMSQEEIEDEVCDRLIQIDNEDDFIMCVMVMLMTHKESMKMMLIYLRDKGATVTRQEAVNAACNIYHFMNDD